MIALPAADRSSIAHGRVEIRSTEEAEAQLLVVRARDRKTVARVQRTIGSGRTVVTVRVPPDGSVYEMDLTARTDSGQIATHRLTVIGGNSLRHPVLRRLVDVVTMYENTGETSGSTRGCRRENRRRWRCRWSFVGLGHDVHGVSTYTLQVNGLIRYREHKARGGIFNDMLLEPPAT